MHQELEKLLGTLLPASVNEAALKPLFDALSDSLHRKDVKLTRLETSLRAKETEFKGVKQQLNNKLQENRVARNRLEELSAKQQALLNATPEAVFSFNAEGEITQMNRAGETFIGASFERMRKNTVKQTLSMMLAKIAEPARFLEELRTLDQDRGKRLRGYCRMRDGSVHEYLSIPEFLGNLYLGRVWCWRDVTELKASQDQLHHQAFHDTLTKLPNRLHLSNTLKHAIELAQRNGSKIAVLFIDLDDFKKINDTEGHATGDQFLISVSARIRAKLREGDTFGRLGGDEFLIILEGLNHEHEIGIAYQRIKEIFKAPLTLNHKQFFISGSIGVSQFPDDGIEPEELIQKADMAMYQAKNSGKNTIYYFEASLEYHAQARMNLEMQLRQAFDNQEFYLHYQPKVDLISKNVFGVEALLRWQQPKQQNIAPINFVRAAEQIGLISQITEYVLRQICAQLRSWQGTELEGIPVSMNISVNDLKTDDFLDLVLRTIREFEIPGQLIEFELTEYVFLEERERASQTIEQLKRWGIEVAVDDFGTGYSCFSYLQDMAIDCLKIDKSFVHGVSENSKSAAIVKSIVNIGNNLNMRVIAEGVETHADLRFLQSIDCQMIQGYLFAQPLTAAKLEAFTRSSRERVRSVLDRSD